MTDAPSPTPAVLHPRPQFRRDNWTDLGGIWRFAFDDDDRGLGQRWYDRAAGHPDPYDRTIVVPYPPESKLSGVHEPGFHLVVWYERAVEVAAPATGERVLLHFGAVDYRATVWVNGRRRGEHEGGQSPFTLDITDDLDPGRAAQSIVVRAEDQPRDLTQPRGKQTWKAEPHAIFYDRTTGIWQPVWLERVPAVHLARLAWTPDLGAGAVLLDVELNRMPETPRTVRVRLTGPDGAVLAERTGRVERDTARMTVEIPALASLDGAGLLWSPETPTLLDAEVVLEEVPDAAADVVSGYVGLRSTGYRDGFFLLNGRPYYLRMALEQGFWPESHLAAPSEEALRREVELIKELGFTGVRIHQKAEDPRFLYWCDRLGLLVWGEMANAFEFSERAVTRLTTEWQQLMRRDHSHPCIVTWVPMNESWGVPNLMESAQQRAYISALYWMTKALDPSRPALSNEGWEHTVSDIWGVHDYTPDPDSLTRRYGDADALAETLHEAGPGRRKVFAEAAERAGQPVVITEFGGLSYLPEAGQKWFGYGIVGDQDDLRDQFTGLVDAILDAPGVSGFCYTQLTDTRQEKNGLLTEDRSPKLPPETIHAIVTRPSRALATEAVDAQRRSAARAADGGREGGPR
ncbi:glycoside hydrolase family 2 protein [Streptomyces boninensis]|uniref:glycoside hydrolase family 2 protein n=1 Tax=Streptomyces boninensis TaxID=2039455 RepID=UPI003B2177DB